jgi:hypothetical protein
MVILKNGIEIEEVAVHDNLKRIINQVYKLLPMREEGSNWEKPLDTLLEELKGMDRLLIGQHRTLFSLLCKMEGLFELTEQDDFERYRCTIFECLSLLNTIDRNVG